MERPDSTLLTNPGSDRVRSVRKLSGRSARLRAGRFVAEGPQSVREAVSAHIDRRSGPAGPWPGAVHELYVTPEAEQRFADIVSAAHAGAIHVRTVSPAVLAAMAGDEGTVTPQGLLAVCDLIGVPMEQVTAAAPRLVAVLARVRDPGNAGTVVRAADAAGADAVVVTDDSVDVHNPKCVRATAGSLFHLPVVTRVPLPTAVAALRASGMAVLAADGAGADDLERMQDEAELGAGPLAGPVAWLFGNEAWGLRESDLDVADAVVRVPVHGRAESLNLAAAATVCLYATARAQRRSPRSV